MQWKLRQKWRYPARNPAIITGQHTPHKKTSLAGRSFYKRNMIFYWMVNWAVRPNASGTKLITADTIIPFKAGGGI